MGILVKWVRTCHGLLQRLHRCRQGSCNEAEERALELLVCNLTAAQREEYASEAYFDVTGGDTGKRYRVRYGYQMNVEELDQQGRPVRLLCFIPKGHVPVGDIMLAQKLALELFEGEAVRIAKQTWDYTLEEQESRMARRYLRF